VYPGLHLPLVVLSSEVQVLRQENTTPSALQWPFFPQLQQVAFSYTPVLMPRLCTSRIEVRSPYMDLPPSKFFLYGTHYSLHDILNPNCSTGNWKSNTVTITHGVGSYDAGSLDASSAMNVVSNDVKIYNINFVNTYGTAGQVCNHFEEGNMNLTSSSGSRIDSKW
jgi:hypothetical protein